MKTRRRYLRKGNYSGSVPSQKTDVGLGSIRSRDPPSKSTTKAIHCPNHPHGYALPGTPTDTPAVQAGTNPPEN